MDLSTAGCMGTERNLPLAGGVGVVLGVEEGFGKTQVVRIGV